ncbi:hypothetical protein AVEN_121441-1 [Araneus ventricosus]|uniref:Tc1-like transposase DDE domain-containing protein n=1 Tax=Araneus ventricosus TaxID=182803 RepID=A0A4Y2DNW8_ARAVE|nr:hypothetical protein AVEN_121441-1 [Araneus ventricosus]
MDIVVEVAPNGLKFSLQSSQDSVWSQLIIFSYFHMERKRMKNNLNFVRERSQNRGCGLKFFWGGGAGISSCICKNQYITYNGHLIGRWFREDIPKPFVLFYAEAFGEKFILMDENARYHRTRLVEDWLWSTVSNVRSGQHVQPT